MMWIGEKTRFACRVAMASALVAIAAALPARAETAPPLSAAEAQALGQDAYLYFYPLVVMDLTRKQSTNIVPGKPADGSPMNTFNNAQSYPAADFRTVVRPNFDTLYSSAWLDLTAEPVIVSAPDTHGRYYLLPMQDMWTDVFASPGWRTTGTKAAHFLVTPPGWAGAVPQGLTQIEAPTPFVWIIGRTKTDGPADYDAVHAIQEGLRITPLSQWGKAPTPPQPVFDPAVDMTTSPKQQADTMPADKFFAYAAELVKANPPHLTDQPMVARLKRIGFEIGKSFDLAKAEPTVRAAFEAAPAAAQKLMAWKLPSMASVANGWSMNTENMGVYGNNYLKRALIAQWGLGANLPEDAVYPGNLADSDGKPLDGSNAYRIHFDTGATPPVGAFWSITLYDAEGFPVANPLNRFALSSWNKLGLNPDGSLDLYFQHESPGAGKEANWLPAPKGPFNLLLRMYVPEPSVLAGQWAPPPVVKQ